jgi:predicted Zn-dependent protease
MLATNLPQGAERAALLASQVARAYSANDLQRTDRLLAMMVEAQPNNPAILADHGQFKARLGDRPAAVALFQRALAAQRALGQPVPESWYQRALAVAVDGRLIAQSATLGRELVVNYPSAMNWRDAVLALRAGEPPRPAGTAPAPPPADPALDLDLRRMARAAGALAGERDYLEFAQALQRAGQAGEAKAVLDEGVSRNMLDANEAAVRAQLTAVTARAAQERAGLAGLRTRALAGDAAAMIAAGDAHFGNGQYPAAAELYRAALQRGAADPALVNTRLGAALALGGQRAAAEAALGQVTGPRAGLAGYWAAWLARRPA